LLSQAARRPGPQLIVHVSRIRKVMNRIASTFVAALLAAGLASCSSLEMNVGTYPTMERAHAAGAVQALSIPDYLPETAWDVTWQYDLDSHETWLGFRTSVSSRGFLVEHCRGIEARDTVFPQGQLPNWWPSELTGDHAGSGAYSVWSCDDHVANGQGHPLGKCFVAVREGDEHVWFWRM